MRQVIKPKDIQEYFGKKSRMSFKMMKEMRTRFNKNSKQPITIDEFCCFYNVDREAVEKIVQMNDLKNNE